MAGERASAGAVTHSGAAACRGRGQVAMHASAKTTLDAGAARYDPILRILLYLPKNNSTGKYVQKR